MHDESRPDVAGGKTRGGGVPGEVCRVVGEVPGVLFTLSTPGVSTSLGRQGPTTRLTRSRTTRLPEDGGWAGLDCWEWTVRRCCTMSRPYTRVASSTWRTCRTWDWSRCYSRPWCYRRTKRVVRSCSRTRSSWGQPRGTTVMHRDLPFLPTPIRVLELVPRRDWSDRGAVLALFRVLPRAGYAR